MTNIKKYTSIFAIGLGLPVLIAASIFVFSGCKRTLKDSEIIGPNYAPAPEGFNVTGNAFTASAASVDFWSSTVFFSSAFSHNVTWTITIRGLQSGAVKTITGLSNVINASNSTWDGGASDVYFFKDGENAVATLTFLGSTITLDDTINIIEQKLYNTSTFNGVKYQLIDDFEGYNGDAQDGRWFDGAFSDLGDGTVIKGATTAIKVEGDKSYRFSGTDVNSNSWLAGINTDSINSIVNLFTETDPDKFYVNLYVYGTGKEFSSIQVKAYEVDDYFPVNKKYNQANNDAYVADIMIDWVGWKLVSLRYADFKRGSDPAAGGNGNGIKEPQKVVGFALGLNSLPTFGKQVEAYVDFVIVTQGGPFKP